MRETEIISDYSIFCSMNTVWNEVVTQSSQDYIFFTHEWFTCWWQAFGSRHRMFLVIVKKEKGIIGIAPLMICKTTMRGFPITALQFMANDDSPWCDFIIKHGHEDVFAEAITELLQTHIQWDTLVLENTPKDSAYIQHIEKTGQKNAFKYFRNSKLHTPWIDLGTRWDFFLKQLSSKSKKTIRSVHNKMNRQGHIEIKECKDISSTEQMSVISKKAWKYRKGKSYLNRDDRIKFFFLLSSVAQTKGWLSLWVLQLDGTPVAYEYHLTRGSKEVALLAEFDQTYSRYSPGAVLDYQILKALFEKEEIKEYHLGGSYDEYKKKWTPKIRVTNDYYLFHLSPYSQGLYYLEAKGIGILRRLKKRFKK